ncbi:MAG TPA: substrate-binding domain-containing protein [Phycisphaerae bacterium]|nr:substrate-binding domain-containing protein [Phycisphaerae bacterium]
MVARICLCALMALLWGCERQPTQPGGSDAATQPAGAVEAPLRIAVIPKGTTHDFWKSVHAGALKAERELANVQIIFRGPEKEDDREQQISLVQNFISSRVDAIVLAPLDNKALLPAVQQATAAKIPVVIIDSSLAGEVGKDFVSYAATNNYQGGQLAGRRLAEVLDGKGRALLLRYQEGSASTVQRERGFVESIAEFPGIELIDPKRYAGPTRATAQEAAENLLTVHSDVQGIFCPNESSTFGMLLALRSRGLAGKVRFVGFDASPGLVEALSKGELDGLVVQNPLKMGYVGVKTAADYLRGKPVEPLQDTGVVLVTRQTMDEPEYKELLSPDRSE